MEHMNIFHRIFHGNLHPLANQKTKEDYIAYFNNQKTDELAKYGLEKQKQDNIDIYSLKYFYYESLLIDSLHRIKWDLHKKLFSFDQDDGNIENLIRNYQTFVLNYMRVVKQNYLIGKNKCSIFQISKDKSDIDIFKMIFNVLDEILVYLEQTFIRYIDHSLNLSYHQRLWFVHQNKEKVQILKKKIQKLQVTEMVKQEVCSILSKIEDNKLSSLTYESQNYYTALVNILSHLFKEFKEPSKEQLYSALISSDFNTFKVFFFITRDVNNNIKESYTNEEKLNGYKQYLKKLKTTTIAISYRLNPNLPSLRDQLMNWVNEEVIFCEHLIETEKAMSNAHAYKRKLLKLSVPEVSLFTKLLYESKLVDGPKTKLFSFVSNNFSTEKSKQISTESLSNNYYSVNESSKKSVRKLLKGMLFQLDQMKGEL